jgi:hypothetical protein
MSLKYSVTTLKKFENLYEEIGYTIRFEKGNFQSGYCVLQERRIAVINKFLPLEGRINALMDMLPTIEVELTRLSNEGHQFYDLAMSIPLEK